MGVPRGVGNYLNRMPVRSSPPLSPGPASSHVNRGENNPAAPRVSRGPAAGARGGERAG